MEKPEIWTKIAVPLVALGIVCGILNRKSSYYEITAEEGTFNHYTQENAAKRADA